MRRFISSRLGPLPLIIKTLTGCSNASLFENVAIVSSQLAMDAPLIESTVVALHYFYSTGGVCTKGA